MKFTKKQMYFLLLDIVLVQMSLFLGFMLRFEGRLPESFFAGYLSLVLPMIGFKIIGFIISNLYKKVWRYANMSELISIIQGVSLGCLFFFGYVFFFQLAFPRSIIILDWMISIILVGGSRFAFRMYRESIVTCKSDSNTKNVLIIGAGDAGEMVLKEFQKHKELNTKIVGFIDDDPAKRHLEIHGAKVIGSRKEIPTILNKNKVDEVIIAMPSVSGKKIREIHKLCNHKHVTVRILPGVFEIINGDVSLNEIREVKVEDLLGREPVRLNMEEIAAYLTSKSILITGGGGSIGSELCRQVSRFNPDQLIIFDISENNVYDIELELIDKYPNLQIHAVIGSIRDKERLNDVFKRFRPNVVFHAAAHKHVPLMEDNLEEAVKNNIFGTRNVAQVAHEFGVERFVMISTDKAVNPTNIMGATKRAAEMIIQDLNEKSNTKFVAVRFGNVLGSRGSVIPIFKRQISKGGPVTVTHKEITRYFMTIPEASQLVIQAGALGQGGEVFVLDMGEPVKIIELAKDLIELSGFKPYEDIDIKITGLRPGEKLYEELLSDREQMSFTQHKRILKANLDKVNHELVSLKLGQLEHVLVYNMPIYLVKILMELVRTYNPSQHFDSQIKKISDELVLAHISQN